ncbi:MAG: hypothetical protein A2Z73_02445 [Deltaproteobacteria bacterium RBG_13_60_28]|nr:MAG: hypothetical protein A2Z73_02445 [Deltaproteobacteria bacterium RBG_13_60_28]
MGKTPGGHHPLVHPRVIRWLREELEAVPHDRRAALLREEAAARSGAPVTGFAFGGPEIIRGVGRCLDRAGGWRRADAGGRTGR